MMIFNYLWKRIIIQREYCIWVNSFIYNQLKRKIRHPMNKSYLLRISYLKFFTCFGLKIDELLFETSKSNTNW